MVFAASLNSLTDGAYRFSDHPAIIRNFRQSLATIRAMPCDILITGHPEHSDGEERLARLRLSPDGYRSAGACKALADRYEAALDARLQAEGVHPGV
ncbi:hypothetical protein [Novosphingobium sp.]|uniref:hypothetical protein n=1 Tax=Novosphingobium sp. TaxID=1874826 RepID=UPI0031D24051